MNDDSSSRIRRKGQWFGHVELLGGTISKSFKPEWVLGPPAFPRHDYVATTTSDLNDAVRAGGTCITYTNDETGFRYFWSLSLALEARLDWYGPDGSQTALPLSKAEKLPPYVEPKPKSPTRSVPIWESKLQAAGRATPREDWPNEKLFRLSDRGWNRRAAKELGLLDWADQVLDKLHQEDPRRWRTLMLQHDLPAEV